MLEGAEDVRLRVIDRRAGEVLYWDGPSKRGPREGGPECASRTGG